MNCSDSLAGMDAYLDGDLDSPAARQLERHAAECEACGRRLRHARRVRTALARLPLEAASAGFTDRAIEQAVGHGSYAAQAGPRRVAAALAAALVIGVGALIYTGLPVNGPGLSPERSLPTVSLRIEERRTVNLVFASDSALDDVSLTVDLPAGVELAGFEGMRRVRWRTRLQAGRNVLPLDLLALDGGGGELTAFLRHGDDEKIFRVNLSVAAG